MRYNYNIISVRQRKALVLAAGLSPVFQVCAGAGWPWVLAGGLAAAFVSQAVAAMQPRLRGPGSEARRAGRRLAAAAGAPLLLWLALRTGVQSTRAFPETAGNPIAAALLLGTAACAAYRGPGVPGRCAGVLLWITAALYGTVLLGSLPQLRLSALRLPALRGTGGPADALRCAAALSVPLAGLCLDPDSPDRKPTQRRGAPASEARTVFGVLLAAALAASLVTAGTLTPALAADPMSFLTLARSVSILGVMQRFEALVSAAMLLSDFCLCALLLTAAVSLLRRAAEEGGPERPQRTEKRREKSFEKMKKSVDKPNT